MPVVSDSSPLILYAKSGLLRLLHEVFDEVWIPPAVQREVTVAGRAGADEIRSTIWILLSEIPEAISSDLPLPSLGAGESEAIQLARQIGSGTSVLLDDAAGRRFAFRLGLRVFGSGGVLVEAKRLGLLPEVRDPLDQLVSAGLYLSGAYRTRILGMAGEAPRLPDEGNSHG